MALNSIIHKYVIIFFIIKPSTASSISSSTRNIDCTKSTCSSRDKYSIKFVLFADWGGTPDPPYYNRMQMRLAEGLRIFDDREQSDFYIAAGDNMYQRGVTDEKDPRFQSTFENIFDAPEHQKPWYLIAGNHDYLGNVSAQIAYTHLSKRWNFPDFYYKFSYRTATGNIVADFLMIDTIILCGNSLALRDRITPPGPKDPKAAEAQWDWIETNLKKSKTDYLFVVGHYPVRSKGRNGGYTNCMRGRMEKLMIKYNVNAYLGGHDHSLQHNKAYVDEHELNYVVSGTAAFYDTVQIELARHTMNLFFYPIKTSRSVKPILRSTNDKPGFVFGKLTNSSAKFMYYNSDGILLYNFRVLPRKMS